MFNKKYITNIYTSDGFLLAHNQKTSDIYVSSQDYEGVIRAVHDLKYDIHRVTSLLPKIKNKVSYLSGSSVIIGTIGKSPIIDALISENKLDVSNITGKWEAFVIQTITNPLPNIEKALVIAGSDKRGTIFGIYDLSEQIGVSPWHYWADIKVPYKSTLVVEDGTYKQGEPSVKYRGIFLNDEGPSLMAWVRSNFRDFSHEFYEKVFELILRLKANYLWPAMWDNAFNEDDPLNPKMADYYGIIMGTSHHEPMLRSQREWKNNGHGPWDYSANKDFLYEFWKYGIERNKDYESIITLGMRGDGDEPMAEDMGIEEKIELLQEIVKNQREIIKDTTNTDIRKTPQLWALYKEVQEYYERGMRVDEDITLLWSDDNYGNLRRVPSKTERKRVGGAGIYYHLDYVGGPRSYKWINTVPIHKIWEQMHKAYEYGADRIWILNVGDLKPMEFPMEYFLRMAWDIKAYTKDNIEEYSILWAEKQFGPEYAKEIAYIINMYSKFNGRLKPELLNSVELYSITNYKEAERILLDFEKIVTKAENIYEKISKDLKDAFYQLVLYPTKASYNINKLYIYIEKNRLYGKQKRTITNDIANLAELAFKEDEELTYYYNNIMSKGKWNHMMDQTHIGYTYWNQPDKNIFPDVIRIMPKEGPYMAVAIEESTDTWDTSDKKCVLPQFNPILKEKRYIEIFNKGNKPFEFNIYLNVKWIKLNKNTGIIDKQERIWVDIDWDSIPKEENPEGILKIVSSCGQEVKVNIEVFNPQGLDIDSIDGFIETNGYISIEAEQFTNKTEVEDIGWEKIDNYGRTLSSMAIFPVTAEIAHTPKNSPCLEYKLYIFNPGEVEVNAILAPSLDFVPEGGLRIGISFDDEPIQIIDVVKKQKDGSFDEADWARSVIYNIRVIKSNHIIKTKGYHTLKIWMVDPIVVLQKLVIDMGGLKPSYLGPPSQKKA